MIEKTFEFNGTSLSIETGRVANLAHGSVIVRQNDAAVLVTAVSASQPREGIDFFPLTVDYRELFAGAGRIPHAYGRREGRLSTREILSSRLIDRSIRPLFPEGYGCETQIMATVISTDPEVDTDVLALMGATAALSLSNIPWNGPAAGLRVVRTGGEFLINPSRKNREAADLDLVVTAGTDGLIMVEGHGREVPEEVILDAMNHARRVIENILETFQTWRIELNITSRTHEKPVEDVRFFNQVKETWQDALKTAVTIPKKQDRYGALDTIKKEIKTFAQENDPDHGSEYVKAMDQLKYETVRTLIAETQSRIDGRDLITVRPITGEIDWVKQPHGSALFTRGETQACVFCTLAPEKDLLRVETIHGDEEHPFFLHYSFPPYSVGEVRPVRGPGRREIGHGNLAWLALKPVIPDTEIFPYAIRVYSEITQSNGSSSMASVCGGTLSLMDAGVPITRPVAGIAMGLIAQNGGFHILTDILGDEDHLGDMDFKVAGTEKGITAIQMDNKIGKLPEAVMASAISQARNGLNHILMEMHRICPAVRDNLKPHAPRAETILINTSKIRTLIGPGGKMIKHIQAESGADISVNDEGRVRIYAGNSRSAGIARDMVEALTLEPEVGRCYQGTVTGVKHFGAFVEIMPGTEGLVHVSEMDRNPVDNPETFVKPGTTMAVMVLGVDDRGKIKLSRRSALEAGESDGIR